MKTYILKSLLLLSMAFFVSCDDFLSEPPEKKSNLEIKSIEALDMLLNHYNVLFDRSREVVLASDSYALYKGYYLASRTRFDSQLQYILWFPELCALQTYYWEQEFLKIAYANTVLSAINDLEGTEADKKRIVEDAHFLRAYEYFNLTTLYCLPYSEENKKALGMPLKRTLVYDEDLTRKSLEETMKFIEDEMKIALETTQVRNVNKLFRISLPAVQAFAARYYLYIHNYEKAEEFANLALTSHSQMVNYQTYFSPTMRTYSSGGGTYLAPNAPSDYKFGESYYARMLYNHTQNAVPSEKLINLYDKANDYRYEAFFVENYSYNRASVPGWSAYQQFGSIGILQGPTTAEMYLIRAECRARKNDTQGAVSDLNSVRTYRYKSGTYVNLTTANFPDKKSLVQFIIDERHREFPFTLRWYDIKRINSDPQNIVDKITITREFFNFDGVITDVNTPKTYTLAPGDKRYAWPLPKIDIELSKGQLVQNPYD
ncbi:MAG: RagB/SusD family nutrient uptake outer membrane protein [Bacteroidales bacterium]